MSTEGEFRHQKERLELLLNLTTKITSSLKIRKVLRAIAANIREVIHADAVVDKGPRGDVDTSEQTARSTGKDSPAILN